MSPGIYKKDKEGRRFSRLHNPGTRILVVLLGLIGVLITARMPEKVEKAKHKTAHAQIVHFVRALESFKNDTGRYPGTLEGLEALLIHGNIEGWQGPYLKKISVPRDPWNRPYHYRSPGDYGHYDIWTYGADGLPGGEGKNKDISTWEYEKEE